MTGTFLFLAFGLSQVHADTASTTSIGVQSQGGVITGFSYYAYSMNQSPTALLEINGATVATIPSTGAQGWGTYTGSVSNLDIPYQVGDDLEVGGASGGPYVYQNGSSGIIIYVTIPSNTIAFNSPVNNTTTYDFASWNLQTQVNTSSDSYYTGVLYQENGQIGSFYDGFNFSGFSATSSTEQFVQKSQPLAQYNTTSTWIATAVLVDTSMPNNDTLLPISGTIVASSSVQFFVLPTSQANTSSSYPLYATPTDTLSNYEIATTTCSSWLDITCEMGNWSTNVFNFLFSVNQNEINSVSGFNLTTQAPWSYLFEIKNDFAAISTLSSTASTSATISLTFGNTSVPVNIFSQATAKQFMGSQAISIIRSILVAFLYLLFIYGLYLEIKAIFSQNDT